MSKEDAGKKDGGGGGVASSTVVLRAVLHCEGCAHKVKRSIKHLDGVEGVEVDYVKGKVTVVGKVDPGKVKERVEEKTKRTAQLVSPKPAKKAKDSVKGGDDENSDLPENKPVEDNNKAGEEKPKEDAVNTVVLKTRVHCDGCARKINKIINKWEGVEDVNVDLERDQITLKGTMDMKAMLPYLNTKLKREVEIAPPPLKDDGGIIKKPKGGEVGEGSGTKGKEAVELPNGVGVAGPEEKKSETKAATSGGGGEGSNKPPPRDEKPGIVNKMEHNSTNLNEYEAHTYDPQQTQGKVYVVEYWNQPDYYNMHAPENMNAPPIPPYFLNAPQMFSDENPNACFVM